MKHDLIKKKKNETFIPNDRKEHFIFYRTFICEKNNTFKSSFLENNLCTY